MDELEQRIKTLESENTELRDVDLRQAGMIIGLERQLADSKGANKKLDTTITHQKDMITALKSQLAAEQAKNEENKGAKEVLEKVKECMTKIMK